MQVNEFKAWLAGFRDGRIGAPTGAQWDKINKEINALETSTGWHTVVERSVPTLETTGIPNDKNTWTQNYDIGLDMAFGGHN